MLKYFLILILVVLAWCPWLKPEEVIQIIDTRVAEMQAANEDFCAMWVDKGSITKVPFGYTEKVSYDCTVTDPQYGVLKSTNTVFVSFYKGIIGMPNKKVGKQ